MLKWVLIGLAVVTVAVVVLAVVMCIAAANVSGMDVEHDIEYREDEDNGDTVQHAGR